MNELFKHMTVDISFCHKTTEDGGRRNPIYSNYRPTWHIGRFHEGRPWLFDGQLELVDAEKVSPGECGHGVILVMSPKFWQHLRVGDVIEMGEGPRVIAFATITAIHRTDDVQP